MMKANWFPVWTFFIICCCLPAVVSATVTQYNYTVNSTDTVWKFNGTGTLEITIPADAINIETLIVGGGGPGGGATGGHSGGGGGAGGLIYNASGTSKLVPGNVYNITVGARGTGTATLGTVGGNSSIANLTWELLAVRGGLGGYNAPAGDGGSGGGGDGSVTIGILPGNGTIGQGYAGGYGCRTAPQYGSGGGGGAFAKGVNGTSTIGGNGGAGIEYNLTGTPVTFSCGGGGATYTDGGTAGIGGCANAGNGDAAGGIAVNDTGSGGGGAGTGTGGGGHGGTGIVIIRFATTTVPISASFTHLPDPSEVGDTVTFTDTSEGSPTTWNWTIEGSITNTTQNAGYTFTTAGTYPINLNVTNATGYFSDVTVNQIVTNVTDLEPQDIWMEGQYEQTFILTDADTDIFLQNVTVTDQGGDTTTTVSNGTAWLTEPFGADTITFTKDGYTQKQVAYVFDSDATHTVVLTKTVSPASNVRTTWYTPHQVTFTVTDTKNRDLPGVSAGAVAVASTFPTGTEWLQDIYGMDPDAANQIMNGTLTMNGTTGSDGAIVFTMLGSIQYDLTFTEPTKGITTSVSVFPNAGSYNVQMVGVASARNNTAMDMGYNTSLYVTEPNASYITLHLNYTDMSGRTSLVEMWVMNRTNGSVINYQSVAASGTDPVRLNYTVPNIKTIEWSWYYNAVRTV